MWQGVGACGRWWGHMVRALGMAWGGECGSGSGLWHRWGHVTGMGYVSGCGGMCQEWGYVVVGQAYGIVGGM